MGAQRGIQIRRIVPASPKGFICEFCGRVGTLDADEMAECIKHPFGPCLWTPMPKLMEE
jgi:hypothetical protein